MLTPDSGKTRYERLHWTLWRMGGGDPNAAPSTVYAHMAGLRLLAELDERGIINGTTRRDCATGRKITSIVQQLARLGSPELRGHGGTPEQAELDAAVDLYLSVRDKPIPEVRSVVLRVLTD